jgi:hypothetical protein
MLLLESHVALNLKRKCRLDGCRKLHSRGRATPRRRNSRPIEKFDAQVSASARSRPRTGEQDRVFRSRRRDAGAHARPHLREELPGLGLDERRRIALRHALCDAPWLVGNAIENPRINVGQGRKVQALRDAPTAQHSPGECQFDL